MHYKSKKKKNNIPKQDIGDAPNMMNLLQNNLPKGTWTMGNEPIQGKRSSLMDHSFTYQTSIDETKKMNKNTTLTSNDVNQT